MREIKYKVWDKQNKQWIEGWGDTFIDEEGSVYLIEERSHDYQSYMHKEDITDDVDVVFYTGLKDKNGKDVYEGDIIKCQQGCPHEVVWLEEYAGTYFGGMPAWYLKGLKEGYAWSGDEEIIGNIYEHPHLLKG